LVRYTELYPIGALKAKPPSKIISSRPNLKGILAVAIGPDWTTGSGVGSGVGVLVEVGVMVGVGVAVGTMVKSGVGVSVGNNCTAPTQDDRKNAAKIKIMLEKRKVLMVNPFNVTLWACARVVLSIPDNEVLGKLKDFNFFSLCIAAQWISLNKGIDQARVDYSKASIGYEKIIC
jgi:hypothetical protein